MILLFIPSTVKRLFLICEIILTECSTYDIVINHILDNEFGINTKFSSQIGCV